jgi:ribosomal protein S21
MIEVKKKEGESANALLFRFSRRIKRSGVLKEANKRRFRGRAANKRSRKISAIHRSRKRTEIVRMKRLGVA